MDFVGARPGWKRDLQPFQLAWNHVVPKERCRQDGQEQGRNHVTLVGVNDGRGCHAASLG